MLQPIHNVTFPEEGVVQIEFDLPSGYTAQELEAGCDFEAGYDVGDRRYDVLQKIKELKFKGQSEYHRCISIGEKGKTDKYSKEAF